MNNTYSSEPTKTPPDHVGILIVAFMLMFIGWGGLYILLTTELPRVGQRWIFFVLLHIAITSTVLPVLRYLNVRFTPIHQNVPHGVIIVRQSVWVGLFVVTCAWLQIPRVLNPTIAFFLALAFIVIEIFLRTREIANERAQ